MLTINKSFSGPFLWTADEISGEAQAMNVPVGGTIFFSSDLAGGLYVTRIGEDSWLAIDQTNDDPVVDWDRDDFRDFIHNTQMFGTPWKMDQ